RRRHAQRSGEAKREVRGEVAVIRTRRPADLDLDVARLRDVGELAGSDRSVQPATHRLTGLRPQRSGSSGRPGRHIGMVLSVTDSAAPKVLPFDGPVGWYRT